MDCIHNWGGGWWSGGREIPPPVIKGKFQFIYTHPSQYWIENSVICTLYVHSYKVKCFELWIKYINLISKVFCVNETVFKVLLLSLGFCKGLTIYFGPVVLWKHTNSQTMNIYCIYIYTSLFCLYPINVKTADPIGL